MSPRKKSKAKRKKSKGMKVSVSPSTSGGVSQPAVPQPTPVITVSSQPAILPPAQPVVGSGTPLLSFEDYHKHRAVLVDLNKANTDQHDKAILQLTGVTLALSVTFVDKIAPNPHPDTYWLLWLGWTWLVISLGAILVSFHTGVWAGNAQLAWLDNLYSTQVESDENRFWANVTTWLNRASCILLMLGVLFIMTFSGRNLPSVGSSQEEGNSNVQGKGSEVPKSAQPPLPPMPDPRPDTGHVPPARPVQPPPIKK